MVESLCRLRLGPASRWQVLWAILATSARFGGRDARLSVEEVAGLTGLSVRTVKAAIRDLVAAGLVSRPVRYRTLRVALLPSLSEGPGDEESPLPLR